MEEADSQSDIYVLEEPGPAKSKGSLDGFTFVSFNPKEDRRARKKKEFIVRRHVTNRHVLKSNFSKSKEPPEGLNSAEDRVRSSPSSSRALVPRRPRIESISAHRVDPFNSLPCESNVAVDEMIQFCVATRPPTVLPHCDINAWGRFGGEAWISWQPAYDLENDDLLLYSRVLGLALIHDYMTLGRPGKAYAYGVAHSCRTVKERMASDHPVRDFWRYMATLSGAVGVGNAAVLVGDVRAAEKHLTNLKKYTEPIGGSTLPNLPIRIRRTFLYVEIRTRMLARKPIDFPVDILLEADCDPLPPSLALAADARQALTVVRLPAAAAPLSALMRELHVYGLASCADHLAHNMEHPAVSNAFWSLYHAACTLSARHRTPANRAPTPTETVLSAAALAVPLFLRTAGARIYVDGVTHAFLAQLRAVLALPAPDPLRPWAEARALHLLAWVLFTAVATCDFAPGMRAWFAGRLGGVVDALGWAGKEEFEREVRAFPWTDGFGVGAVEAAWREAVEERGRVTGVGEGEGQLWTEARKKREEGVGGERRFIEYKALQD